MERWKVLGLPTTYIIDSDNHIAYKAVGGREFNHPDILEKVIGLNNKEVK